MSSGPDAEEAPRHAAIAGRAVAGALAALGLAALLVAGCAGWTTNPELTLHVNSAIDRPLLVYVNGDWVGTIPAGVTDAVVPAAGHGGPPWTAEGRVASGAVLITLPIPTAPASGQAVTSTVFLACGTLTMTAGTLVPGPRPQPPGPGVELPPCD
jgi:hypothetical protein